MTFQIIEAKFGPRILVGHLVPNAGKNNGTLIRQDKQVYKGESLHKVELYKVFYTKGTKKIPSYWRVQIPVKKVTIPVTSLIGLIECLTGQYEEIFGKPLTPTTTVKEHEWKEGTADPPDNSDTMEELRKLGF